ncbi:hypothetical protein [Acidocella sp.]|uniref:GGDEF domain-containing protein n=1 Tax=Acidocella sp. TaxID=50710 RepID=UPI0026397D93|nr:hypothetical protein [Acidocella sp.]
MKPSPLSPPAAALAPLPGMSWLGVAAMLADLAFETDIMGRFTAFGPGRALGQPAAQLMGGELAALITGGPADETTTSAAQLRQITATICAECVAWHGRVRLAKFDGTSGAYRLSLAPRLAGSAVSGLYGLLFDLDNPEFPLPGPETAPTADPALRHNALLDSQTGLWSGRTFADELSRRLDRLDVEEQPGTLLYLGFSRAQPLNRVATALRLAEELRDIVRPTDLLGRIDETTIGLWCDNMDHLTGGERAARFCTILPPLLPERTPLTVGVASRWAGSGEDTSSVLEHAAVALRLADMAVERTGPEGKAGAWRVWQRD